MKNVMILGLMFLFLSTYAQPEPKHKEFDRNPEEKMEQMLEKLTTELALSSSQEKKIRAIMEESMLKAQQIKEEHKPAMEEMREKIKSIREEAEGDKEAMREELHKLKEEHKEDFEQVRNELSKVKSESLAKISEVLDYEQRVKFFEFLENDRREKHDFMKEKRGKRKGHHSNQK